MNKAADKAFWHQPAAPIPQPAPQLVVLL